MLYIWICGGTVMKSIVIDREALTKTISSYIRSPIIRLVKESGSIILSPFTEEYSILEQSFGMFSDGKLSSERFKEAKKAEKELEG
jgi:hypothetical protein